MASKMASVRCQIDSIRVAAACPERTLILKPRDSSTYLPIWISPPQAQILADQLNGRPDSREEIDAFLADNRATDSDIGSVTVYLESSSFFAKVLLFPLARPHEVRCSIGVALAMAVRAHAPILVDDALFDRAGVCLE